jgi:glycosyltransferase involved in cell wall biosynthesis
LKVLHVIPAVAACYGGPSRVVLDTCKTLRDEGIEAEIATTNADGNFNLPIPDDSPTFVNGVPVYFFERQQPWDYKFSWGLTRWLKRNVASYDLLHIHAVFSYPTAVAAFYARKHAIPYIILPHGMLTPWAVRQNWLLKQVYLRAIEERNLEGAAAVHFTAEEELRISVVRGPSNFVLPCVVDFETNGNRPRPDPESIRIRILFLSRIDPKKGIELLIDALSRLAEEGLDFELILAGSGEQKYEDRVKAMIHDAGLSARTRVKGFVEGPAKADLFATSDIFVLPSHQENFGIAVVEAMTFGLPVIISDRVNIHDEIAKVRAGLIISTSVEELCKAIRTLSNDPLLRFEMGQRGKDLVQRRFCGAANARETLRVYRDIIQDSRESSAWKTLPRPLTV